jgi:hypothetical protein
MPLLGYLHCMHRDMLYRWSWTTTLILLSLVMRAQTRAPTHYIHGNVRDSISDDVLEEATISCWPVGSEHPIQTVRSNRNGFVLRIPQPGKYQVISTYLGYIPDTTAVAIAATDSSVRSVRIRLQRSSTNLMQVVVKAGIPPVIVRSDTIGFNASAFPTRPYASVEDLLRKLPGIAVDKDGNVTMQGKKIDKILVDGKEFFLGDIKTATQNLPAEIVAQVEAFDSQTEQGKLTGIRDNTGGKTLNIKLKKDRKSGYFGKVYAGGGNDKSYAAGGTAASLGNSRNFFINGETNNINNQFNGTENNIGPSGGGLQTMTNGNFNYRDKIGKKITAIINGGYYHSRSSQISSSGRQTFLGDSSLIENRLSNSSNSSTSGRVDGRFEYAIDSLRALNVQTSWSPQNGDNVSSDTVGIVTQKGQNDLARSWRNSQGQTNNTNSNHGYSTSNSLDFRQRFLKKGRTFYLGLNQSSHRQDQTAGLYSLVNAFDSVGDLTQHTLRDQRSTQSSSGDNYGARLAYTEPLSSRRVLDFGYQVYTNTNHSDKHSFDHDSITGKYDIADTLTSNKFSNRNTVQQFHAGFNADGTKFRYQLGLAVQLTDLDNQNYSLHAHIQQHFTNWYPRANLIWILSQGKTVRFGYTGSSSAPSIDQLQPLPDLTNPFLVRLGNPDLQQSFQHNMDMEFSSFKAKSLENWQVNFQGDFTEHAITAATTLLAGGVQQLQYVNIEGNYHLSSNLTYGFPLWTRQGNASIGLHGQYSHQNGYLNGQRNNTDASAAGVVLKLNYHPSEKLFLDVNAALDYSANAYSLNLNQNTQTLVQNYTASCSYELPLAITITSFYNWQQTGAQGSLPARAISYWNAAAYKSIFRNRSGQVRFSIFNILDGSSNVSQSAGPNYIETSRSNLIGRLWLLSLVWHFRKFPGGKPPGS